MYTHSLMASPLIDFAWLLPATNYNHTCQEAHKDKPQAPVSPRPLDFSNQDALTTQSSMLYTLSYMTS